MLDADLKKLAEPFEPKDIEWRVQAADKNAKGIWARVLAYVTNRAIMKRLDDVVGPSHWRNEFIEGPGGGVLCGISIYIDSNIGWVTKWDGAENTDIEEVKGGLSGSMKRSAVQWGIGRYLYELEADFAKISASGALRGKTKKGDWFNWDPPKLPEWALPKGYQETKTEKRARPDAEEDEASAKGKKNGKNGTPKDVLDVIKKRGSELSDEAEITIKRKNFPLKEYIRENWDAIKSDPSLAAVIQAAIEKAGKGE